MAVIQSTNNALIKKATISSTGVSVQANTGNAEGTLNTAAGYSSGNIGIGGAISVNVSSAKTNAKILKDASITLKGGSLDLAANANVKFGTNADASGSEKTVRIRATIFE